MIKFELTDKYMKIIQLYSGEFKEVLTMYILEKTLEFIFLPSCGVCGKLGEGYLCKKCGKELEKYVINKRYIVNNLKRFDNINVNENIEMMHIFEYKEIIRKLIINYKFNDKSYLYKNFCEFIVKNEKSFDFIKSYDIIIPVPIHKKRMRKRGYNQSELIAKELAQKAEIKCYTDVLMKIKNNKMQSTLSKKEREENTKNVYKLKNKEKIYNKKVLIFDDIYTTGATIISCTKELEKAEVNKIGILTLAKD